MPRVGVLGLTFKENVTDLRNSRVPDIIYELRDYGVEVVVHDPLADPAEAEAEYGIHLVGWSDLGRVDGLVIAVPHQAFVALGTEELIRPLLANGRGVVMDVKGIVKKGMLPPAVHYWRL